MGSPASASSKCVAERTAGKSRGPRPGSRGIGLTALVETLRVLRSAYGRAASGLALAAARRSSSKPLVAALKLRTRKILKAVGESAG